MTTLPLRHKQALLSSAIILAMNSQSFAAGFALIEQSVPGLGNAYAGAAASAEDASTIFFNPAGLSQLESAQFIAAMHIISPSAKFSNNGSSTNPLLGGVPITGGNGGNGSETGFAPNIYFALPISDTITAGLGINAPFGLKTEYDRTWVGRYHAVESDLKTTNINPAFSYRMNDQLALGFGIDLQYVEATLSKAVDFGTACISLIGAGTCVPAGVTGPQSADGFAQVYGTDWSWGMNAGLLYTPTDATRIGLNYRSKVSHELTGSIDYTAPSTGATLFAAVFQDQPVHASVSLPETVSLSVAHEANDRWTILGDVTWTHWSRFKELRVVSNTGTTLDTTTENWENVYRVSLGANYRYSDTTTLRIGIAYDEEPIPDAAHRTPRIPGNDRKWLALGTSYAMNDSMTLDAGYTHLFISDTPINNIDALGNTLTGTYKNDVDILSAQVSWTF